MIDHLCRNRSCVRPDHLQPVTQRENTLRGMSVGAIVRRTGKCLRGHPMAPGRECQPCNTLRKRRQRERRFQPVSGRPVIAGEVARVH